ncbi:DEAD/DEAH box helicase [Candidatus Nitrospira allomarina]|uniref:DEAD/DEAH box helicase n=1 Tax=Candidatus Nitrospira allomarina TaxID=3020900 RepID=A0AA96GCT9_9BACT|nr:DEAD/DEAH box helicase [Candidatus Nitrospira allomarina]WNM57635.1 DEAD/DEAH box helicase [Candidatus Nitrospira allomarina]
MPLNSFHPVVQEWFTTKLGAPTDVQRASWPAIHSGQHALISAPTGSGKTLAAFLTCIDHLLRQAIGGELEDGIQVVYVSPLRALSHDIHKNLELPLAEISELALSAGFLGPRIRVEVRTGDTPPAQRQQQLKHPPHILVTTPESLFLLVTAKRSRELLTGVHTVIVDEIHALAPNKRGAHLALSLERLDAVTSRRLVRIGLSATQRPLERVAHFLLGESAHRAKAQQPSLFDSSHCHIVDIGHRRQLDLQVEVPKDELGAIATNAIWSEIYDRIADIAGPHRSTLVFVNTRRLAERVAHHLEERLGENQVASHHGSLSRKLRLDAEERLKTGRIKVMVATASLELGIDIGCIDVVCQIGSPRAIATCLQRVGRAGHQVGAVPQGRLFCTTRDELVECAAVVRAIRQGQLETIEIPSAPLDILIQQIIAEVAAQEWNARDLFALCRSAYPYRELTWESFESLLQVVAEGFVPGRRRLYALMSYDRHEGRLRPKRGGRLAALTSGGAIPETATYQVVAEPDGTVVGTVDEDFAIESLAGDIMLLGTTSWRIRGIETGKVRVEDAHGAPPNIPFWRGEAPSRSLELSQAVADVREQIFQLLKQGAVPGDETARLWFYEACGVDAGGADQLLAYVAEGTQILGGVPTQTCVIAERFFDEAGGMQLVLHAPFGGRVNRAWGLALRKRFCVNFDFELQAAATDDGLVLSLGEQHSFPLEAIFGFVHPNTVREVLIQATLATPLFLTRWRWNVTRALALLRFQHGKRVPVHLQRMRAEDLLAAAFPMAAACGDNHVGDIPVPDHQLVQETLHDCLTEAMDLEGLRQVLERIENQEIQVRVVESPVPSMFAHEILNANPYAFLDDAPLEERRARAVNLRRTSSSAFDGNIGTLDAVAIDVVVEEAWPVVRDADELFDVLQVLGWLPFAMGESWHEMGDALLSCGRLLLLRVPVEGLPETKAVKGWTTREHLTRLQALFPEAKVVAGLQDTRALSVGDASITSASAARDVVQGWMPHVGPVTADELSRRLNVPARLVQQALLQLEGEGQVLRGHFRPSSQIDSLTGSPMRVEQSNGNHAVEEEWCDRSLLARIHRRTVTSLRREIEPVAASDFMRFLFRWQHRAPGTELHGEAGLREVIHQLAGFEAPASAWESSLFTTRLAHYKPEWLDLLCLRGEVAWGRLTPPESKATLLPVVGTGQGSDAFTLDAGAAVPAFRPLTPTRLAPISFLRRQDVSWILSVAKPGASAGLLGGGVHLSGVAQAVCDCLDRRGACFFADLTGRTGHLPAEVEQALWELVATGLVTADGFDPMRALLDPRRRRAEGKDRARRPGHSVGRWDLFRGDPGAHDEEPQVLPHPHEQWARQLAHRYGVVFRDLLKRESLPVTWRELLVQYRKLEWRGEMRGGRFVNGFTGEQFALPDAVESLRAVRRDIQAGAQEIRLSAADPLNLVGIILPGERISAHTSKPIFFRNGVPSADIVSVVSLA